MPVIERSVTQRFRYVDLTVEGTRFLEGSKVIGWRITTTSQERHHEREYWLQGGEVFLTDIQSSRPWSHATPFIVGPKATRIHPEELEAITKAMTHWNPPAPDPAARGRKIKLITEGPYIGFGIRRSAH